MRSPSPRKQMRPGLLAWRGQHCGERSLRSRLPTITFGSEEAARIYATRPNDRNDTVTESLLFRAVLRPGNLLCFSGSDWSDPFIDLEEIARRFSRETMLRVARDCADHVTNTNAYEELHAETGLFLDEMLEAWPDRIDRLPPVTGWAALSVPAFVEEIRRAGYDMVVVGGLGETGGEVEYHVLDPGIAQVDRITTCIDRDLIPSFDPF